MSEQSYDIRVSLSDTNFNEQDRQEAETLFAQLGRVQMMWYLRESLGDLVPVVIIVVGTAFASGFFGKMGEDTYDALKSRLADWLSRKRHPSEATNVTFELPYDSTTIKAYSKASSAETTKQALKEIPSIKKQLDNQKLKGKLPSPLTYIDYSFDSESKKWKPTGASCAQKDDISRYHYDKVSDSWQTEFHIDPSRLSGSRSES